MLESPFSRVTRSKSRQQQMPIVQDILSTSAAGKSSYAVNDALPTSQEDLREEAKLSSPTPSTIVGGNSSSSQKTPTSESSTSNGTSPATAETRKSIILHVYRDGTGKFTADIVNGVSSSDVSSPISSPPSSFDSSFHDTTSLPMTTTAIKRRGSELSNFSYITYTTDVEQFSHVGATTAGFTQTEVEHETSASPNYSRVKRRTTSQVPKRPTKRQKTAKGKSLPKGKLVATEALLAESPLMNTQVVPNRESKIARTQTAGKGPKISGKRKIAGSYYIDAQIGKPEPCGHPEVWAQGREALCSALPYYKSYQGSAYTVHKVVKGCLIDKESGYRDIFNHEVIITDIGGGKSVGEDGRMARQEDQKKTIVVQSWFNAMERKEPIGVVAGQGNKLSPAKLPHAYNVLGWFHITNIWSEKVNGIQFWRIRLEKIDLSYQSWWTPRGMDNLSRVKTEHVTNYIYGTESINDANSIYHANITNKTEHTNHAEVLQSMEMLHSNYNTPKTAEACCMECKELSKVIFTQGWACLNPDCLNYFDFGYTTQESDLEYSPIFLQERTRHQGPSPQSLRPAFEVGDQTNAQDSNGKYCKGIICPKCGCCSRRMEWLRWKCENSNCTFKYSMPLSMIDLEDAIADGKHKITPLITACARVRSPAIKMEQLRLGRYATNIYQVVGPSGDQVGIIAHFKADDFINMQPYGPDVIYSKLQLAEMALKRRPVRQQGHVGEILTNHFGANWGAPYKYGVKQHSKPFSEAPTLLHRVVQRLTWAGKMAVEVDNKNETFNNFNELLTLAYLKGQSISYHDDGEKELGPTVASLSLGAYATMSWRHKKNVATTETANTTTAARHPVLKILLKHGDIMVMHGADIQKYFEHEVTPHGPLRFGLTCRYIRPERLPPAECQAAIVAGTLPECEPYDGDAILPFLTRYQHDVLQAGVLSEAEFKTTLSQMSTGARQS